MLKTALWRLNSYISNNPATKEKLKIEIKSHLEKNDNEEVTPFVLWNVLKAVIRGKIIEISSYTHNTRQKLKNLEDKKKKLQKEYLETLQDSKVANNQNDKLISKITIAELQPAIGSLQEGKSPGTDGFTSEWFKVRRTN